MDANSQAFFYNSKAYFEKRTRDKALDPLKNLELGKSYKRNEMAYDMKGRCIDPYAFKEYRDPATGTSSLSR